ncbi:MAG: acyl carrier protein [Bacteroidales bacterium]
MDRIEIIERVNEFLAEDFEVDKSLITAEANLRETLDLDSLDYVDLVVVIESNFGFKVQPGDFQDIAKFEDLYNYIETKYREKQ